MIAIKPSTPAGIFSPIHLVEATIASPTDDPECEGDVLAAPIHKPTTDEVVTTDVSTPEEVQSNSQLATPTDQPRVSKRKGKVRFHPFSLGVESLFPFIFLRC